MGVTSTYVGQSMYSDLYTSANRKERRNEKASLATSGKIYITAWPVGCSTPDGRGMGELADLGTSLCASV